MPDGAGWHGAAAPEVPDDLALLPSPLCSPDPDPVGNGWRRLRRDRLGLRIR